MHRTFMSKGTAGKEVVPAASADVIAVSTKKIPDVAAFLDVNAMPLFSLSCLWFSGELSTDFVDNPPIDLSLLPRTPL